MKKAMLGSIGIAMLAIFAVNAFPVYAWVVPPSGEDNKYELYGPHVKGIQITMYASEQAEWTDMDNNLLDLSDWPLTQQWIAQWYGDPRFTIANYGGEAGYYLLDLNNNDTLPDGSANPCANPDFRRALAYCVNRTEIVSVITLGLGIPMWTVICPYMSGYVNNDIYPGAARDDLTYGGWECDLDAAKAILDVIAPIGGDGWRTYNGVHIKLKFYVRSDHADRFAFGTLYAARLSDPKIKLDCDFQAQVRAVCSNIVMGAKNFHMYTGGWIYMGPDPDYMYDLYNYAGGYWHPGKPPNYGAYGKNDPKLEHLTDMIKFNETLAGGKQSTLDAQIELATNCAAVPVWCSSGVKVYRNTPVQEPEGPDYIHFVNEKGIGVNSWWSTLNVMKDCEYYPPIYLQYGFKSDLEKLNPVYAESYWDWEVLGRIYDGGAARDPMTLATWVPQLYNNWTYGLWQDLVTLEMKSKVKITLRPDLYWQDGHPVTIADVYYTLVEISKDIIAKGLSPPWWYSTVQYFRSNYIIDDYNMEILLDVNSIWATGWVIGTVVLPKHIWKPLVDISTTANPVCTLDMADPNVIGSGPYRFVSKSPGVNCVLDANTPGSVVNGIVSPGYWQYCPVNVDVKPDNYLSKINIPPSMPSVISNITITLRNWWQNDSYGGDLIVNKYVWLNGTLLLGFPHDVTLHTSADYPWGASNIEVLNLNLPAHSLCYIKVAVHIKGPAMLDSVHPNPWISQWINVTLPLFVTIREDITGSTIYDLTGFGSYPTWLKNEAPAPDIKVDGKDVGVVQAAWGSKPGDVKWDPVADVVHDYKIDTKDLNAVASKFGWPGPAVYRDVAVTAVTVPKKVVFQGSCVDINVTAENQGEQSETFNLLLKANDSIVQTEPVSISVGSSTIVAFTWNTSGWAKGNYTISAEASIAIDFDPADNSLTGGWIIASMVGDIRDRYGGPPDGKCTAPDVSYICSLFGVKYPDPRYDPDCDQTSRTYGVADWQITAPDVALVSSHFGQTDP